MDKMPPTRILTVRVRAEGKEGKNRTVIALWQEPGRDYGRFSIDKSITEEEWLNLYRDAKAPPDARTLYLNHSKYRTQEEWNAIKNQRSSGSATETWINGDAAE